MSYSSFDLFDQATRIVVFGKNGQVGRALQNMFKSFHASVVFLGRADCDLSNQASVIDILNRYQPQIIINASAYTAVDLAESERDLAFAINCDAVRLMAEYVANISKGLLIHFSTDYVYSGLKQGRYLESDVADPASVYGQSKLAGEVEIHNAFDKAWQDHKSLSRYFIFRTSWVYGDGNNFIRTMLRLAAERDTLKVVADQHGVPTSADWLASIAIKMVESKANSGIYHAVPDGQTSWHGLAMFVIELASEFGEGVEVRPENILPINSSEYSSVAPRPKNSRMDNAQLKQVLSEVAYIDQFPSWQDQVTSYVRDFVRDSLNS
jgi:dTDP-4-dehydrorhamnose reductase